MNDKNFKLANDYLFLSRLIYNDSNPDLNLFTLEELDVWENDIKNNFEKAKEFIDLYNERFNEKVKNGTYVQVCASTEMLDSLIENIIEIKETPLENNENKQENKLEQNLEFSSDKIEG